MALPRLARVLTGTLGLLALAYGYAACLHPLERRPAHPYFDRSGPWVVAHRGGMDLAPENTLLAFERAEALGVDVLEMDLRFTSDGTIVLMHDATVDRTTDGRGRIDGMTVEELQGLDAGYRFEPAPGVFPFRGRDITVPSFAHVLMRFPTSLFNVEMKDFAGEEARTLCGVIRDFAAENRILISAFGQESMDAFREACPEVATGATRREAITLDLLRRLHLTSLFRSPATTLQVPPTFRGREVATPELLELARASNRPVQVWTVNEEAEMKTHLDRGVQAILTDRPDRLLSLLGRGPVTSRDDPGSGQPEDVLPGE